ncbi:type VI secretion system baseplate subunit TssK [Phycisphaeraceae bacterium D3-23]
MMHPYVHWHEGLFLGPHHLQVMSQAVSQTVTRERTLAMPYPYGVIEAKLAPDSLENKLVRFDRLRAVMPSGLLIDTRFGADLPALNIEDAIENAAEGLIIRLALPLWKEDAANTVPSEEATPAKRRELFNVEDREVPDENTGTNARPVSLRRLNARLILEGQDTTDLETLPLMRIALSTVDRQTRPRLDPQFAPPCLQLRAWPTMTTLVRELAEQVAACREEQAAIMNRGGFNLDAMQGPQVEQMLRLRTLNVYTGRFRALADNPVASPADAYLEMAGLMGELAGLRPGTDPFKLPKFDHDRPLVSLLALNELCRKLLAIEAAETWWKLDLVRGPSDRSYQTVLDEKHLTRPNQYFLAIKTGQDVDTVIKLVEDGRAFKCMPMSLEGKTVYGVPLKYDAHPPLGLPLHGDLHYFRMQRSEKEMIWDRINDDRAICCHWQGMESTDFDLSIYMTVPQEG